MAARTPTLDELRAMVGALDPDVLAAETDVDGTLIAISLERSPFERVRFAQQMPETLSSFVEVKTRARCPEQKLAWSLPLATLAERNRRGS